MACLQCTTVIDENEQYYVTDKMSPEIISVIERYLGHRVDINGVMCLQCFGIIMQEISNSALAHEDNVLQHSHDSNVCVRCRTSLFRRRAHSIPEGPVRQHIAEMIAPIEDQTKILIAKVYHYFEQEYEELKTMYGDLDLTPLSKFRQRTALATGVSETKILEILKEEEGRNADKRQAPPAKRRGARKRSRQTDSSSEEDSSDDNVDDDVQSSNVIDSSEEDSSDDNVDDDVQSSNVIEAQMVIVKEEPTEYINEEPEIYVSSAVKVESSDFEVKKEQAQTDPISIDVKTELQADVVDKFMECPLEEQRAPSPSPSSSRPPTSSSRPPPRHFRRNLRPQDIAELIDYGSDQSSDSDDGEEGVLVPRVSRAFETCMETPLDEDFGVGGDGDGDVDAPAAAEPEAASASVPLTATDQPWRWYDFEWKEFPDSVIQPESRREIFSQINVGPTTPRDDPYAIFVDIWDRPIMEHIVSETNKYAQRLAGQMMADNIRPNSRICRWRETTADELYVYFGIILAMGVVVKSRLDEYWSASSNIFCTPGFSAHMPIDRFLLLNKCIHFNDNDGMRGLDLDVSEARLYKIQPILSYLNKKFQDLYNPAQNIALDESLLMWKGWLEIGQLIPNKAAKKGIKTYEICESQTGYLWRFEVHSHKKSELPPQQLEDPLEASTPSIVLRLTQGLEHKGYTLWMDNFYNSPCLARRLKSLGFDCVGTLRTDRKFVPQTLHSLTKRSMCQGQVAGLTSGDVDVMVWKDCNRVATISTYHGNAVQTIRGSTKPILILDYNIMMGGVDKKDQLLAMYPVERKRTLVWYKKLFRRLLNISVLNSYIIHNHSSSHLTHRKFRMQLILALFSHHRPNFLATTQNPRFDVSTLQPSAGQSSEPFYASIHRLDEYDLNTSVTTERRRARRRCKACKRKVTTFCVGCNTPMCMHVCFAQLHPHPRPIPL